MARLFGVITLVMMLVGCSIYGRQENTVSSSLVDFLYPDSEQAVAQKEETPVLKLPVNIGIAFVPAKNYSVLLPSAKKRYELLSTVKNAFVDLDYVNRIEIIPDTYLKQGGGFDTLNQLARLYDIEVMALVSYDQVARNNENNAALLYWTIAGLYLIPGNDNSTQTFVDTALFDIKTQKLLFRAPGISKIETLSTAVGLDETIQENSEKGFNLAVADMINNLNTELGIFKERVKEEQIAKIESRSGYSGSGSGGGGAGGILVVLALLLIAGIRAGVKYRQRSA